MAKKPETEPQTDPRQAAINALLALAADNPWGEIGLADIADRASLSLSQLRGLFPSKGAILSAYARQVDQAVLDGIDADLAQEPAHERLLDRKSTRLNSSHESVSRMPSSA